ncbi:MAG: SRPBCC domain-containing protein [Bacteroidia bacterium]
MPGRSLKPINHEHPVEVGDPAINTLSLAERDGRTTLTISMLFPSKEARDGAIQSGMSDGMAMSYDMLDGVLAAERVG